MDDNTTLKILGQTEPFCSCAPDELSRLLDAGEIREVEPNTAILGEGSWSGTLHIILSGKCRVTRRDPHGGKDYVLADVGPGAIVGEVSLLHRVTASATVRTLEPSRIFKLGHDAFHELIEKGELAAYKLTLGMAKTMAERMHLMHDHMEKVWSKPKGPERQAEMKRFREHLETNWNF
jgi:CRP-like cAMP-binding protein